jgi:ankyrin repeat protein
VTLLISLDVDINKADNYGYAPLDIACYKGYLEIVKLLLYYDVDMTRIRLSNYKRIFNLPNDQFSNTSTNDEIK